MSSSPDQLREAGRRLQIIEDRAAKAGVILVPASNALSPLGQTVSNLVSGSATRVDEALRLGILLAERELSDALVALGQAAAEARKAAKEAFDAERQLRRR